MFAACGIYHNNFVYGGGVRKDDRVRNKTVAAEVNPNLQLKQCYKSTNFPSTTTTRSTVSANKSTEVSSILTQRTE